MLELPLPDGEGTDAESVRGGPRPQIDPPLARGLPCRSAGPPNQRPPAYAPATTTGGLERKDTYAMLVETGIPTNDLRAAGEAAKRLEALGYDGVVTPEVKNDPFLPLAVAATTTERVSLGTSVAIAFPRSPMI